MCRKNWILNQRVSVIGPFISIVLCLENAVSEIFHNKSNSVRKLPQHPMFIMCEEKCEHSYHVIAKCT